MPLITESEMPSHRRIRSAIFARNGAGKTRLHSTIPARDAAGNQHRVLVASIDIENIDDYLDKLHYRIFKLNHWDDNLELYELVLQTIQTKSPVTDLVWDTWSRNQDLAIGKVTGYNPSDPEKLRQYINRIPKRPNGWDGWGQVGALLNEWMANFNRLPINVYYLVQENDRENRTDNYTETGPRLTPEAVRGLRDAMQVVGRLYVSTDEDSPEIASPNGGPGDDFDPNKAKKGVDSKHREINPDTVEERRLFIGQHERYQTKGPTHLLGRVTVNPTWETFYLPILTRQARTPALPQPKEAAA